MPAAGMCLQPFNDHASPVQLLGPAVDWAVRLPFPIALGFASGVYDVEPDPGQPNPRAGPLNQNPRGACNSHADISNTCHLFPNAAKISLEPSIFRIK